MGCWTRVALPVSCLVPSFVPGQEELALLQVPYQFHPFVPTWNAVSTRSNNQAEPRVEFHISSIPSFLRGTQSAPVPTIKRSQDSRVPPVPLATNILEQPNGTGTGTRASSVPKMLFWNNICTYLGATVERRPVAAQSGRG